jgi:hypothetical protein
MRRTVFAFSPWWAWGGLLLVALLLAGCAEQAASTLVPTPYPTEHLPTVIALTYQAGRALTATTTPLPTASPVVVAGSSPQPSATPAARPSATRTATPKPTQRRSPTFTATPARSATITPTPTNTRRPTRTPTITSTPELPLAAIQFFAPGPLSRVVAPLRLSASVLAGPGGQVRIELLGEDSTDEGPFLYRRTFRVASDFDGRISLLEDIDFAINGVSQLGRLQIVVEDTRGRLRSKASVDLILLAYGDADITPPSDGLEPIIIRQPLANTLIQGGSVLVTGLARPSGDGRLFFDIYGPNGESLGANRIIALEPPSLPGGYTPFAVSVGYTVTTTLWVRVVVYQLDTRINGITQLSSVEVLVSP